MTTNAAAAVKNQVAKQTEKKTVAFYLENQKQKIAEALPACGLTIDRFARLAISTLNNSPELQKCDPLSFMRAMMTCAQLGIEPSPVLGTCYLLPFNNRKAGIMEVQFILGYKGMITLARRSGEILSMAVRPVYANDIFKIGFGMEDTLEHVPYGCREDVECSESGAFRGVYMVCKFKDGGHLIDYMPKPEIERHRAKSLAKDFGPWKDFYEEMALKTIIRKNFKYLPSSTDVISMVEQSDDTQPEPSRFAPVIDIPATHTEHAEEPMTDAEIAEVSPVQAEQTPAAPADAGELQIIFKMLADLATIRGESPDDMLYEITSGSHGRQQDLEDVDPKKLKKLRERLDLELSKEA